VRTDRRSYADPCGIARALDAVGERWGLLIVRELMFGPRRFGQLAEGLPGVSPNVLSQRLRELEGDGIVRRYELEPPANVPVYELTERGRDLEPVLIELGRWGSATARIAGRELSPAAMLFALRTMFDPKTGGRVTYALNLSGEWYGITIDGADIRIERGRPESPNATLSTDVVTLRLITFAGVSPRDIEADGKLGIEGDRRAALRLPKYFRRPTAAATP
jgi:DNA-binding HxlR family transcriptional regulator